jgi:hypothetical protein
MNGVPATDGNNNSNNISPLKNAKQAQIDPAKFNKYSMNSNNPNNRGKWKAFEDVGYNVRTPEGRSEGAQHVIAQIEDQLLQSPATFDSVTSFGLRYQVNIKITGPNGRVGTLITKWQYDMNSDVPKLITNWLQVHK